MRRCWGTDLIFDTANSTMSATAKRGRIGSAVWEYFLVKDGDPTLAICNLEVRRGNVGASNKVFSTK